MTFEMTGDDTFIIIIIIVDIIIINIGLLLCDMLSATRPCFNRQ